MRLRLSYLTRQQPCEKASTAARLGAVSGTGGLLVLGCADEELRRLVFRTIRDDTVINLAERPFQAHRGKHGIIKGRSRPDIVGAKVDLTEHRYVPS